MHCSSNNKNNLYHSASKPLCPQPILMVIVSAMIRAICSCKRKKNTYKKQAKENQQYLINTRMTHLSKLCSLIPFFPQGMKKDLMPLHSSKITSRVCKYMYQYKFIIFLCMLSAIYTGFLLFFYEFYHTACIPFI